MVKHNMLLVLLSLVFLGLLLPIAINAEDITITYSMWVGHPSLIEPVQQNLRRFEAANPGIKVELMAIVTLKEYRDRLLIQIAANNAPDLAMISRTDQSINVPNIHSFTTSLLQVLRNAAAGDQSPGTAITSYAESIRAELKELWANIDK